MKPWLTCLSALLLSLFCARQALAWASDFSKEQIEAVGHGCVHGYEINWQTITTYHVGDVQMLRQHLKVLTDGEGFPQPVYASQKVILHPRRGKASSPWDKTDRGVHADWSAMTWRAEEEATPHVQIRLHLQIDIWLGGAIKLEDLKFPADFEVISGGEIEDFVKRHKEPVK